MTDAYFTTRDGSWFEPTGHTRGPWDKDACHAGPPTALLVRALERLVPKQRLARISVELMRPIPMAGFRV
nr:thioesterase family protein [Acidimicrobiia bacterium]